MNNDFALAMAEATRLTGAQNPAQATRVIQDALSGRGTPRSQAAGSGSSPARLTPLTGRISQPAETRPASKSRRAPRQRMPLGSVLRQLRQGRALLDLPGLNGAASAPPPMPQGAQFLRRSFSCNAGARDFRLYIPAALPENPRGLVVMLHGCTQNPEDFATGTGMNALAEERGLLVVWPEQTRAHNASACWNWFRPGDQRRDAGEPAIIAGITRQVASEFNVARSRVFAAGLSSGGAMAAILAETSPELFAAIGVHSGLPAGSASDVISAFAAMRGDAMPPTPRPGLPDSPRLIVFHGSADGTVHASNGERLFASALGSRPPQILRGSVPGGHSYTRRSIAGPGGVTIAEHWLIEGSGHAWSGGRPGGSHVDANGPDASSEMLKFFLGKTR